MYNSFSHTHKCTLYLNPSLSISLFFSITLFKLKFLRSPPGQVKLIPSILPNFARGPVYHTFSHPVKYPVLHSSNPAFIHSYNQTSSPPFILPVKHPFLHLSIKSNIHSSIHSSSQTSSPPFIHQVKHPVHYSSIKSNIQSSIHPSSQKSSPPFIHQVKHPVLHSSIQSNIKLSIHPSNILSNLFIHFHSFTFPLKHSSSIQPSKLPFYNPLKPGLFSRAEGGGGISTPQALLKVV